MSAPSAAPPEPSLHLVAAPCQTPATDAAIDVRGLVKRFDDFTAVNDVTFAVRPGEIFGFLGPNGAGKSTTIKMLCTLLQPTAGAATVNGSDVVREPDRVRASIGIIFQDYSLDDRITAEENLRFHCMIYHVPRSERRGRIAQALELVDYVFPGMLAMAIIFTALQSAVSVIFDREFGFLKEILVAPIPRPSIAIGKALAGATIATIQGIVIFFFAPLAGVRPGPLALLTAVGVMLLTAFGLTAVGLLFAARMTSFEGFGTINNFIVMPLYFASGAQFPLERAPQWMQTLSRFNPLTYAVDLLRGLLIGVWSFDPRVDLLVLAGFALVALT
ncbi:MAG TPA: ABC transporter permease [Thermomicrobiales bacterium]|nr:ABC transporter permease [Thermomicrobiales bacterium]